MVPHFPTSPLLPELLSLLRSALVFNSQFLHPSFLYLFAPHHLLASAVLLTLLLLFFFLDPPRFHSALYSDKDASSSLLSGCQHTESTGEMVSLSSWIQQYKQHCGDSKSLIHCPSNQISNPCCHSVLSKEF